MESSLPVLPGPAGPDDATAAAPACRYPGCGNPARARAGDGPGAPPRYCGQAVAEDRGEHGTAVVTHTALTAFRRRQELAGTGAADSRPVTSAIARATAIRDDVLAAITALSAQLEGVLGKLAQAGAQLAAAASPEAAEAQIEAIRAETAAGLEAARAELAGQAARAHAVQAEAAEARAAAGQAIAAMAEAETARAQAEARAQAADDARDEALRQASQARAAAAEQASQVQASTEAALAAAHAERDAALAEAATANAHAQAAREHLAQLRDDHDRHAAALTAAHQAQVTALDEAITELRARLHRAETDAAADRAERQHLTDRLHELTTARPPGVRKTATS
jgi:DNA repair exonuclease SbcCD ATPase subunit